MESQGPVSTKSSKGVNRIWLAAGGLFILCCCGVVVMTGAAGIYYFTSAPPVMNNITLQQEWLVTADELNSFSLENVGIVQWQLVEATPGQYRICNTFTGVSDSFSPNAGSNCIFQTSSNSLQDNINSMFEDGSLFADEVPISASFDFEGEYALYGGTYPPTAHKVYDLLLLQDGLMYWSSVTTMSPPSATALEVYQYNPEGINNFLERIIRINLERSQY